MKLRPTLTSFALAAFPALILDLVLVVPAIAGGSIAGSVSFDGTAPTRRTVKMAADPKCDAANPDGRLGEVFVINDGKLQNVFVYIKEGLGDKTFETPKEPVNLDQKGCMYEPHVIGAMVGQTIVIKNSDSTLHNVHSLPKNSKQFNAAMPMANMTIKKKFASPEVMVRIKCDVHPWMASYVGVVANPFHSVSGADGSFTISDVPAGTYTIEAWHEKLGTQTMEVTVSDGAPAAADFTFAPKS